jgi:hypothetical protein
VRPASRGQIEVHVALGVEHRRHQQRIAEQVLAVEVVASGIVGEFQQHRAQHRRAMIDRLS